MTQSNSPEDWAGDPSRWRVAVEASGAGLWDWNIATGKVFYSDASKRMIGYAPDEIGETPEEFWGRLHLEDRDSLRAAIMRCRDTPTEAFDEEFRLQHRDGTWRWMRSRGRALGTRPEGGALRVIGTQEDISSRREEERTLRRLVERLARAQQVGGVGVWETDLRTRDVYWSDHMHAMLGTDPAIFSPTQDRFLEFVHADDRVRLGRAIEGSVSTRALTSEEYRILTCSGEYRSVLGNWQVVEDEQTGALRAVGTCLDITEAKRVEEALRVSLQEKNGLLMEVHHRVKNNLQVMASLLRLESGRAAEPATRLVLGDMQSRVRAMALLHETLYRSRTFARLNLGDYLKDLANQFFRAQNHGGDVRLALDLAPVWLTINQAAPCGLLVNELLTNACKYGFPGGRSGEVRVALERLDSGAIRLTVADNGVGLPEDFEARREKSLGLHLVADLAKQLGGTLEMRSEKGASFAVTFTPKDADAVAVTSEA